MNRSKKPTILPTGFINVNSLPLDIQAVILAVCTVYSITPGQLIARTRKRHIVDARKIACNQIYFRSMELGQNNGYSLEYIAEVLNYGDHSTVIHARDTCMSLLETDKKFEERYQQVYELADSYHKAPNFVKVMNKFMKLSSENRDTVIKAMDLMLEKQTNGLTLKPDSHG